MTNKEKHAFPFIDMDTDAKPMWEELRSIDYVGALWMHCKTEEIVYMQ